MRIMTFFLVLLSSLSVFCMDYVPSNFLYMSPKFNKHLIIAEKTKLKIHIYEVNNSEIKRIKSFKMAYGKSPGNKSKEGDKKTPEGVYFIKDFFGSQKLVRRYGNYGKIYGAGAFTLDYPNIMDKIYGKTGNGIWLHSTNDESRIAKGLDSRGCLVVGDADIKEISKYIDIGMGTPIIVLQDLSYIDKESQVLLNQKLKDSLDNWALSWKLKDLKGYVNSYHKNFKSNGRGLGWFREYKRKVFKKSKDIVLKLSNYTALQFKDYAVVTVNQYYKSNLLEDKGIKTLYFNKNSKNEWKIVHEVWSRDKNKKNVSIGPDGFFSYF